MPDLTDDSCWQSGSPFLLNNVESFQPRDWDFSQYPSPSDSGIDVWCSQLNPENLKPKQTSPTNNEPISTDDFLKTFPIPNFQSEIESMHKTSTEIIKIPQKLPRKSVKKSNQNPRTLAANRQAAKKYRAKKKVEEKQTLLEVKEANKKAMKLVTTFEVQEQNIIKMLKSSGFIDEKMIKDPVVQADDNPLSTKNLKAYLVS